MPEPKRLRVLQIAHDHRGPFVHVCAEYVKACEGHDVTTVYLAGDADDPARETTGGDVRFLGFEPGDLRGIKWALLAKVRQLFREAHYDIVIAHRYKSIYVAGVMSAFYPVPCVIGVLHEHGVLSRPTRSLFFSFWRPGLHAVAVSDSVARSAAADCAALADGRLSTLYHCIEPAQSDTWHSREEARQALGIDGSRFVLGSVGRLVSKKRYDLLIGALTRVGDAELVLVGDGGERSRLEALVGKLGLSQQVRFVGHMPNASRYLRAFDAFVMTSGAEEAFGIVLLEAMLAGVPIVCSDAPGPAEALGDAGLQFRDGDEASLAERVAEMISASPSTRAGYVKAGRERVLGRFSPGRFREAFWSMPPVRALQNG
tara:strand:+ start:1764 stop:2879 length:1116 start_codon:yes stop_codon:yes gene_type:complete